MSEHGFIFGAQYYRAPTPPSENWESDLKNMKKLGFNSVKFWVQWGWTNRKEGEYYFEDTDRLMDLAYKYGLKVTLNVIFDVAPVWIFKKYPDSKIVLADGTVVEPKTEGHRQIGGFPGTCYNHPEAFAHRMDFLRKTVERYKNHPALEMWDIWNEPEQCGPHRYAKADKMACFCKNCREKFKKYAENKYETIENLNKVWGRCYSDFEEVQIPIDRLTFADFIDYREFHLDSLTNEANERIMLTKSIDTVHTVYLHVVPNTSTIFNALTGVDDFELAKNCDIFASTNFAKPIWSILTVSAAPEKKCYNVECHIGSGSAKMHQKQITLHDMTNELLPQLGMGIKGFMFWQYRPEILGMESPAWGVTKPDGSTGSVGIAAKAFMELINPAIGDIMTSPAPKCEVAVWKGRRNEILSFCIDNELDGFSKSIESYVNTFYYNNFNCRIVNDELIEKGLDGIKLLILPYCYGFDSKLAKAVDRFVSDGGTVLCEAHLGAYNADIGRHSYNSPGCCLDEMWDIHEKYTTSSYHLNSCATQDEPDTSDFNDDVKKAIDAYGLSGGKYFPIKTVYGYEISGCERFACLESAGAEVLGTFNGETVILKQKRGKGTIYYCGSNIGCGSELYSEPFEKFVLSVASDAGVSDNGFTDIRGVHVDRLNEGNVIIVNNTAKKDVTISFNRNYKGLFVNRHISDTHIIARETAEIFIVQ